MNRMSLTLTCSVCLLLLATGCYTKIAVNCGNGFDAKVRFQSSETGREIEVAAHQFGKLAHSKGDIFVSTPTGAIYKFSNVTPFDVPREELTITSSVFGPNSVTLSVNLETNMQLYVVMPDGKDGYRKTGQPGGYPKQGLRTE